jgi:hypothetical protein
LWGSITAKFTNLLGGSVGMDKPNMDELDYDLRTLSTTIEQRKQHLQLERQAAEVTAATAAQDAAPATHEHEEL